MLRQMPVKKFKRKNLMCPFFFHSVFIEKDFFSNAMRQLLIEKHHDSPPPGLLTRIRDGVETFDTEEVMKSCKHILKEKIPVSLKSLHIEFLNHSLYSCNKLFKFGWWNHLCVQFAMKLQRRNIAFTNAIFRRSALQRLLIFSMKNTTGVFHTSILHVKSSFYSTCTLRSYTPFEWCVDKSC